MKYWLDIKDKLIDRIELATQFLLLMLGAYIFIMAKDNSIWKVPVLFIGLLSWFFMRDKTKHPIIWIVFFVLLVIDLFHGYFWVANHHFMLMFMVLSILFYKYHKRSEILEKNIQMLLFVVVIASVLQKLMSSQFMNGNFYYYMMNRGSMFSVFLNFFPDNLEVIKSNSESISMLYDTDPNNSKSIILKDGFANLGLMSVIFVWTTVVLEFIVAFAILWKPKSILTHLFLTTMILGILSSRLETGFMALLAICGLFLCNNLKLRLLYVMIVIGCITFVITKIGYH